MPSANHYFIRKKRRLKRNQSSQTAVYRYFKPIASWDDLTPFFTENRMKIFSALILRGDINCQIESCVDRSGDLYPATFT
jgi:hypothetical protein